MPLFRLEPNQSAGIVESNQLSAIDSPVNWARSIGLRKCRDKMTSPSRQSICGFGRCLSVLSMPSVQPGRTLAFHSCLAPHHRRGRLCPSKTKSQGTRQTPLAIGLRSAILLFQSQVSGCAPENAPGMSFCQQGHIYISSVIETIMSLDRRL
jgi:hypothetical protein